MVDFAAFIDDDNPPKLAEFPVFLPFENTDTAPALSAMLEAQLFKVDDENPFQPPVGNEAAFFDDDDGADILLDKFYLFPEEIDVGFITEDLYFDITTFSLFRVPITVEDIEKFNFGGAILQHPTTPFEMLANSENVDELTILKTGQPFQQSTITYFVDAFPGYEFQVSILGQRIIPFLYEPNFDTVEENYLFETVKYIDEKGNEQRRSIGGERARIEFAFNVLEDEGRAQRLRNDLRRYGVGVVGVPFFADALHLREEPQLQQTIKLEESLEFDYNLKNCAVFVLLKRLSDDSINEIKEITAIDDVLNEISLTSVVVNSYPVNESIVYPILLCYMDRPGIQRPTEDVLRVNFRFKEFV